MFSSSKPSFSSKSQFYSFVRVDVALHLISCMGIIYFCWSSSTTISPPEKLTICSPMIISSISSSSLGVPNYLEGIEYKNFTKMVTSTPLSYTTIPGRTQEILIEDRFIHNQDYEEKRKPFTTLPTRLLNSISIRLDTQALNKSIKNS